MTSRDAASRTRVFLSYSRRDEAFAIWLRQQMVGRNIEVFRDVDDTLPGEAWWGRLQALIQAADTIVFLLSPRSATSEICQKEIAYAESLKKRVYPVVLEPVDWSVVPDGLASRHSVYFTENVLREASLDNLISALLMDIDWVREHTRIYERAINWERRGRVRSELLSGSALEDAEAWLAQQPGSAEAPTWLHRAFIKSSRDSARRRQRWVVGGSLSVAAVALALASLAYVQRAEALRSQSIYLAKLSRDQVESGDPGVGLVLALSALPQWRSELDRPIVQEALDSLSNAILSLREEKIFKGHNADVNTVSFSPDGQSLLTSSDDGKAIVWDVAKASARHLLDGHNGKKVFAARYSHNGKHIATIGGDDTAVIWSSSTENPDLRLHGHTAKINTVAFAPDDKSVLTASSDGTARIWMLESQSEPLILAGHGGALNSASFDRSGSRILTTSDDTTARIWRSDGSLLHVLRGHDDEVIGGLMNDSGSKAITYSSEGKVLLWELAGEPRSAALEGHDGPVTAVAFCNARNPPCVVTGTGDGTVRVWNAEGTDLLHVLRQHAPNNRIEGIRLSPDEKLIATASRDGTAIIWSLDTGEAVTRLIGHTGELFDVSFNQAMTAIATASRDQTARLWRLIGTSGSKVEVAAHSNVVSFSVGSDGRRMAVGLSDGSVNIYEVGGQTRVRSVNLGMGSVTAVAFDPASEKIIAGTEHGGFATLDAIDLAILARGEFGKQAISGVAFVGDGGEAAVAAESGHVQLIDAKLGIVNRQLEGSSTQLLSIAVNRERSRLLTASIDGTVNLWDLRIGKKVIALKGGGGAILQAVFSHDSRKIFLATEDGRIRSWDIGSGKLDDLVYENGTPVTSLAVNEDGSLIVGGGHNRLVSVWRIGTSLPIAWFRGHNFPIVGLAFRAGGSVIISADGNGTVQSWSTSGGSTHIALGRSAVTRCLSNDQIKKLGLSENQLSWCSSLIDGRRLNATGPYVERVSKSTHKRSIITQPN